MTAALSTSTPDSRTHPLWIWPWHWSPQQIYQMYTSLLTAVKVFDRRELLTLKNLKNSFSVSIFFILWMSSSYQKASASIALVAKYFTTFFYRVTEDEGWVG